MTTIRLGLDHSEPLLPAVPAARRRVLPAGVVDFLEEVGSTVLSMFAAPFRPLPTAERFPRGRALDPATLRDIGLDR